MLHSRRPAEAVVSFLKRLEPTAVGPAEIQGLSKIAGVINFSTTPVTMSGSDPGLRTVGGLVYKSSGNPEKDKLWLSMLAQGEQVNPNHNEVRTTDAKKLVAKELERVYSPLVKLGLGTFLSRFMTGYLPVGVPGAEQ